MSRPMDSVCGLAATLVHELGYADLVGDGRRGMAVAPFAVPPVLLAAMLPRLLARPISRRVRRDRAEDPTDAFGR